MYSHDNIMRITSVAFKIRWSAAAGRIRRLSHRKRVWTDRRAEPSRRAGHDNRVVPGVTEDGMASLHLGSWDSFLQSLNKG